MNNSTFTLAEVENLTGLNQQVIAIWISNEWVAPSAEGSLDTEDVARLRLIRDLISDLGVNDEAVPIILHLTDQLYRAREALKLLRIARD